MISGHVLAGKNEKISKSKDNAKSGPKDLLEKFWADATRYRAASGQLGKDIVFEETELKNGQRLITKLRNACQFVKIHLINSPLSSWVEWSDSEMESKDPLSTTIKDSSTPLTLHSEWQIYQIDTLYPTDQRILSRLNETVAKVSKAYENYEVGLAKIAFEEFFWKDFCDNYLEFIKNRLYKPELYEDGESLKASAQYALSQCFCTILRLVAPIIPHVTEELYQDIFKSQYGYESLHLTSLPTVVSWIPTVSADHLITIVGEVRGYKTTNKLSLGADVAKIIISWPQSMIDELKMFEIDLLGATKAAVVEYRVGEFGVEILQ